MRDAFAGVRDSVHKREDSDLSCCVYGQSCTLFCDSDLAASLDTGRHLQAWLGDNTILVDRYDVRLLLHDDAQISKALHTRDLRAQEADTTQEDLDFERYRDLNPEPSSESASPDDEEVTTGPEPEPEVESSAAYAAVPFVYSDSEAHAQPDPDQALLPSRSAASTVPDIAFTPTFVVPAFVQKHLPETERMHRIILQTAKFVRQAGGQTEFFLRVKQAANPNFNFLEPTDLQHPYFRWLVSTNPEDMLFIDAAPSAAADSKSEEATVGLLAHHAPLPEASSAGQPGPAPSVPSQPDQGMQEDAGAPKGTASSQSQTPDPALAAGSMSAAADSTAPAQLAALPPLADMQALARRIGMTSRSTLQPAGQSAAHAAGSALAKPQQLALAPSHPRAHAVVPSKLISPAVRDPAAVPAEIQAIIRKLVLFIKKAGPKFEATVRNKEKANPRFAFLLPWNQYHQYYRQQLVDVLGQATADEVIALREHMSREASASQPDAALASTDEAAAATSASIPSQAAQAAAEDLHNQAAAAIPQDSSLAQTLPPAEKDQVLAATAGTTTDISVADAQSPAAVQAEPAGSAEAINTKAFDSVADADDSGHVSNDASPTAAPQASARSKLASSGITVVRSNPRFASKPPREESDAVQSGDAQETGTAAKGYGAAVQSSAGQSIEQEAVSQPVEQEQHAAHAAALSLEAVIEAQSALLQERQHQLQPNMTEEEKKAHRRRLMRQMLEAKQKSEEDAEEQRRKEQQSALAKYRQAFASDAEEEVIHMKLEDDEEYEAPEPGEIVDEPEVKPVSGPVLSAPAPSPLPSLEALIRPRQDLVPQQRTFPLPLSVGGKSASQSNDRGAKPSTATSSDDNDSEHMEGRSRKHTHKRKRARRRSRSSSSDSSASSSRSKDRKRKGQSRHYSRSKKSSEAKHRSRHKRRRRSRSSSYGRSSSQSPPRRSRHSGSDNAEDMLDNSADALRAKVRAMLGHL
ncbi:TPA: hypothetical protein ACH3X2_004535 [Trebouxia sp. C0005]